MLSKIKTILDSDPFQIFFLLWTAVYLVQIYKGQITLSKGTPWGWLIGGIVVSLFIL
jgi:hypothetical protein